MQFHRSTFENDTVELDGNAYDHCDFKHCILVYRGGSPPRFAQCSFLQYSFQFEDAVGNTLSFWPPSIMADSRPTSSRPSRTSARTGEAGRVRLRHMMGLEMQ